MAAIITPWDFTSPADTDPLSSGDDSIRAFKLAIMERLGNGGHTVQLYSGSPTTITTDGRHCAGAALAAGASELAGEFVIYASDKSTALVTFRDSTAAAPSEVALGALKIKTTGAVNTGALTVAGALTIGGDTAAQGSIIPSTHNAYDLGSTGFLRGWRNLYVAGYGKILGQIAHSWSKETISATPRIGAVNVKYYYFDTALAAATITFTTNGVDATDLVIFLKNTGAVSGTYNINGVISTLSAGDTIVQTFVSDSGYANTWRIISSLKHSTLTFA